MTREQARNLLNNSKLKGNNAYSLMLNEALNIAIEALEQKPCDDCINKQAVLDIAKSSKSNWIDNSVLFKRVNELPSVTPQPKMGHWIEHKHNGITYIECSECSSWFLRFYLVRNSYCPNCGAKMEVDK